MTVFELRTSSIASNRYAYWAPTTGHICGLVLSGLASYCDNPSLNPAEVLSLNSVTKLFEKEAEIAEKDTELKMWRNNDGVSEELDAILTNILYSQQS